MCFVSFLSARLPVSTSVGLLYLSNAAIQLKTKTMWLIHYIMNKGFFVCVSEVLPHCAGVPESTRGFELSGQRHHSSEPTTTAHSCCSSPRTLHAFVLLIVLRVFKGLPGTIGHLEAFKWNTVSLTSYSCAQLWG